MVQEWGRYKHWNGLLERNTGLDYQTELFSFFGQVSVIFKRILTFSYKLGSNFNCNNDNICLLQYFQQCINQELCYSHLKIRAIYVYVQSPAGTACQLRYDQFYRLVVQSLTVVATYIMVPQQVKFLIYVYCKLFEVSWLENSAVIRSKYTQLHGGQYPTSHRRVIASSIIMLEKFHYYKLKPETGNKF